MLRLIDDVLSTVRRKRKSGHARRAAAVVRHRAVQLESRARRRDPAADGAFFLRGAHDRHLLPAVVPVAPTAARGMSLSIEPGPTPKRPAFAPAGSAARATARASPGLGWWPMLAAGSNRPILRRA